MSVARGYPPRPFCSSCILWFDTPEALIQHVTRDPKHISYICETCGLHTFLTLEELKCHQNNCIPRPHQTEGFSSKCVRWYGSVRGSLEKHWREGNCGHNHKDPQPQPSTPASTGTQTDGYSTHGGTSNTGQSTAVPTDMETEAGTNGENPREASVTPGESYLGGDTDDRAGWFPRYISGWVRVLAKKGKKSGASSCS